MTVTAKKDLDKVLDLLNHGYILENISDDARNRSFKFSIDAGGNSKLFVDVSLMELAKLPQLTRNVFIRAVEYKRNGSKKLSTLLNYLAAKTPISWSEFKESQPDVF